MFAFEDCCIYIGINGLVRCPAASTDAGIADREGWSSGIIEVEFYLAFTRTSLGSSLTYKIGTAITKVYLIEYYPVTVRGVANVVTLAELALATTCLTQYVVVKKIRDSIVDFEVQLSRESLERSSGIGRSA